MTKPPRRLMSAPAQRIQKVRGSSRNLSTRRCYSDCGSKIKRQARQARQARQGCPVGGGSRRGEIVCAAMAAAGKKRPATRSGKPRARKGVKLKPTELAPAQLKLPEMPAELQALAQQVEADG